MPADITYLFDLGLETAIQMLDSCSLNQISIGLKGTFEVIGRELLNSRFC